ncbi:OLC1v1025602C1 [Oldenlandia corymbosa var. corymbosa]|uniref:OLC1v1025602C1 n=1 Tax=Oldenlandia corymbosa var. corymbosa TaxID=529605 RepID=A0AAV1C8J4_OLDCO|nr:OLC1v1025602C1 [Oldenlandia corymbosa var. corymbosa]
MAATMKGKINRKDLVKLNIIKICEEIMNPSVPMALRLSGILMGGVVIVYERKVKLLFDDVNRLLVELNQAWKVQVEPDPTVLPKSRSQAKRKSITLPENQDHDLGDLDQSLRFTNETPTMMKFTQTNYVAMRLDSVDDPFVNQNPADDSHQADVADITMVDIPDLTTEGPISFNRFERFDIEGDEDTNWNIPSQDNTAIPTTLIPSPRPEEKPLDGDENLEQHTNDQVNMPPVVDMEFPQQNHLRQGVNRRRGRRRAALVFDDEHTIIPGHVYQSWLQDTSDISSRKRNRSKKTLNAMTKKKIATLMELPPIVLVEGLYKYGDAEVYFPVPLLELWRKSTQPLHNAHFGPTSTSQRSEGSQPSITASSEGNHTQDPIEFPFEDSRDDFGSVLEKVSIEKQRRNVNDNPQTGILMEELRTKTIDKINPFATPGTSSDSARSIPSSGSGHGFHSHTSENNSSKSSKKRPYSPNGHINIGLEPVDEENSWQHPDPNLKLAREYENDPMSDSGPKRTRKNPDMSQPADPITNSIRMQLKAHFETPGAPEVESLNALAHGMDRKRAASLFYQTCVLATEDSIRVLQKVAYGDIYISRGPKI